jgi:hypothetical protein
VSHHFDYQPDADDVSDVYIFPGPSDDDGPRTVIAMNASPQHFKSDSSPWDSTTFYELKLDLNGDYVADITWRFTFTKPDANGNQYVTVAQLTGADATSRTAPGKIITEPHAPVGQVLDLRHDIKAFAGERLDPFFNDVHIPLALQAVLPPPSGTSANPALPLLSYSDTFMNQNVRSVIVEVPAAITGLGRINCWGTTAIFDQAHPNGLQVQRAGSPVLASGVFLGFHDVINATEPDTDLAGRPANPETDPASGIWGEVRDLVAAVVEARGTYNTGKQGRPTPRAYGAFAADSLLPNVLPYTPGTSPVLWTPWDGFKNGRGLREQSGDNFAEVIINEVLSSRLTQVTPITDYFPYLAPPLH